MFNKLFEKECRWYMRLWRMMFPGEPFTQKKLNKSLKELNKFSKLNRERFK